MIRSLSWKGVNIMELLIVLLIVFLKEFVKQLAKDLWKFVKKRIKKATFTPEQRKKGGKPQ